jgi:hypothetical protein
MASTIMKVKDRFLMRIDSLRLRGKSRLINIVSVLKIHAKYVAYVDMLDMQ